MGYLSQLLSEEGKDERARLLRERHAALTGEPWRPLVDLDGVFN